MLCCYTYDGAHDVCQREIAKHYTILHRLSRHEATKADPAESGGANKVGERPGKARREVDVSSGVLEDPSKHGPNRTPQLLSCEGRHI